LIKNSEKYHGFHKNIKRDAEDWSNDAENSALILIVIMCHNITVFTVYNITVNFLIK